MMNLECIGSAASDPAAPSDAAVVAATTTGSGTAAFVVGSVAASFTTGAAVDGAAVTASSELTRLRAIKPTNIEHKNKILHSMMNPLFSFYSKGFCLVSSLQRVREEMYFSLTNCVFSLGLIFRDEKEKESSKINDFCYHVNC
jgi:hypothetical protein